MSFFNGERFDFSLAFVILFLMWCQLWFGLLLCWYHEKWATKGTVAFNDFYFWLPVKPRIYVPSTGMNSRYCFLWGARCMVSLFWKILLICPWNIFYMIRAPNIIIIRELSNQEHSHKISLICGLFNTQWHWFHGINNLCVYIYFLLANWYLFLLENSPCLNLIP